MRPNNKLQLLILNTSHFTTTHSNIMDDEQSHFPSYQQYLDQNHMDEDGNYNPKTLKDCIYDKLPDNLYQLIDDLDPNTKLIPSNINDDETNRRYYSTVYGKADLYDDDVNKEESDKDSADEIETHEVWSGGGINTKEVDEKNTTKTTEDTDSKMSREDDISTITDEISKLTFTLQDKGEDDDETCPICTAYLSTGGISPPSKATKATPITNTQEKYQAQEDEEQQEEDEKEEITPYKMPCCNAQACTKCTEMICTKLQQQRDGYRKAEFGTTWCLHCCIPIDLKDSNSISEYTATAGDSSKQDDDREDKGDNSKGEEENDEDDILNIDPITLKKRKGKKKKRTLTNEEAREKEDNAWIFPRDERYEDYRIPGTPFKVGNYEDLIKGIVKKSSVIKKEEEGDVEEEDDNNDEKED